MDLSKQSIKLLTLQAGILHKNGTIVFHNGLNSLQTVK